MHTEEDTGAGDSDADRDGDAHGAARALGELPIASTSATARYVAAAAVVCPLGNDVPVKSARGRSSGRARSMMTLIVFEISI